MFYRQFSIQINLDACDDLPSPFVHIEGLDALADLVFDPRQQLVPITSGFRQVP